jgi:hypothetical protein
MPCVGRSVSMEANEWNSVERRHNALGLSRAAYFQFLHRLDMAKNLLGELAPPVSTKQPKNKHHATKKK